MMMTRAPCAMLHLRIANHLAKDSSCRGGIVDIRAGCSRALLVRLYRPKALWRFRVSTSNSRTRQRERHDRTPFRRIDHIYAQQGIQGYEDYRLQLQLQQFLYPKALGLLRVSI